MERSTVEKTLAFAELLNSIKEKEASGLLPEGFIPPQMFALAVNKAFVMIIPEARKAPETPPEQNQEQVQEQIQDQVIPESSRVQRKFPSFSPEAEQGSAEIGEEKESEVNG